MQIVDADERSEYLFSPPAFHSTVFVSSLFALKFIYAVSS